MRLQTGDYANIEIQRIGYQFPGQRCAAYSSDVMMRQIRKMRREDDKFKYAQLKKVYTIVFIEQSIAAYWQHPDKYIHHARQTFDTGLELDLLQEFIIIPLDVFRKIPHNEIDELKAWLYFIGSDEPRDICHIVEKYPRFRELYKELIELRYNTKGLLSMFDSFRELLRECDKEAYEEMFREMKEQKELFIKEQEAEIAKQDAVIAEKEKTIAEKESKIAENEKTIAEKDARIAYLEAELAKRPH